MIEISDVDQTLQKEARHLAQKFFGNETEKCASFTNRLLDICARAQGKDLLLIRNPGGWGSTGLDHCFQWERSIVTGISATIEKLGYTSLLIHYLRTGKGWREKMQEVKAQFQFFTFKARLMAAELEFLTRHINNLKVILIGVSQGAAFGNAVMQCLPGLGQVYSIEFGMPFFHISRRVITERTLVIDSNGLMLDAIVHGNLIGGFKAYLIGPFRWLKYQLQGRPVRFAQCINPPGHEYYWSYPKVQQQIEDFLQIKLGTKSGLEGGLS